MQFLRPGAGALGIGRQSRGDQLKAIIEPCCNAVHRSNESARPAADHSQPETPVSSISNF
jgi:hypothetical protein